jgi:hypothetical protein
VVDDDYLKRFCTLTPDSLDPRDRPYMAMAVEAAAPRIPRKLDHSTETGPPGDQRKTASCVGWSCAYLRRWQHFKSEGTKKGFSVRFVWMSSKELDPWTPNAAFELAGTRIRDAFKVMNKYGVCPDTLWRFDAQLPDPEKQDQILREAMRYRIGAYHALDTNVARRVHLAKEGPFVVGVPIYGNWSQIGRDGIVPHPSGKFTGGHAVLVVGYDDEVQRFKFQNSWGRSWGAGGYGYFPYGYMEQWAWNSWGAVRL